MAIIEIQGGPAVVKVDPDRGGEITSYSDSRIDGEILWVRDTADQGLAGHSAVNQNTQGFYDDYRGGIQELFPNTADATTVFGAELPFHGEVCSTRFQVVASDEASVTMRAELKRYPVLVEKRVAVSNSGSLQMSSTVTNLSGRELPYSWALHPVFSHYFTGEGARLVMKAESAYSHPSEFSSRQKYAPGSKVPLDSDGGLNSLALTPAAEGVADLVYVKLEENWFRVGRPGLFHINMKWSNALFDSLWVWQECHAPADWPWWGRFHMVGIEPHTTHPASQLSEHVASNNHRLLGPNATETVAFEFELSDEPED